MREQGVSSDCSRPTKVPESLDNVVIIDVDSDGFDNVIVIDVPESIQRKLRRSSVLQKGGKFPLRGIICVDDDDDGKDVNEQGSKVNGDEGASNESRPGGDHVEKSVDADDEDCQVVNKKRRPFNLSKCKRTYTKKTPSRNRYGLYSGSESDSSQGGSSDCEVMEGTSGELREQWEKASLKRRSNVHKSQHGLEDQTVPCSSHDADPDVEVEINTEQQREYPTCSSSENVNAENSTSFVYNTTEDKFVGSASLNPGLDAAAKFKQRVERESFQWSWKSKTQENGKADDHYQEETAKGDDNFFFDEAQKMVSCGTTSAHNGEKCSIGTSWVNHEEGDYQYCNESSYYKGCKLNTMEKQSKYEKSSFQDVDILLCKGQQSGETHDVNHGEVAMEEKDESCMPSSSGCKAHSNEVQDRNLGSQEKENLVYGENLSCFQSSVPEESSVCKNHAGARNKNVEETNSMGEGRDSFVDSSPTLNNDTDPICAIVDKPKIATQGEIILDREKHKETDEYKRAVEEEWAARQEQVQIQAEEAQRLRKRKKAESLRALEMEKRQKQRVEEVRESQKKDEENLSMKERLRVEKRKELYKLEIMCIDMASLLRGLGIHVGGGLQPSPDEVHSAYKRALLKFHPDRASRTDIHQQVDAEEKFKLISRMKKFLSTSCNDY